MKPKAGDKVKVETTDGTFEGTLLPRPELLGDDITVLKLTTGYNIGIENKKIKQITVLGTHETKETTLPKQKKNSSLPTVAILSTGGTIASRVDYLTGGVKANLKAEDFLALCPELADIANIETSDVLHMMSEDATTADWQKIAQAVHDVIDKVNGVVITHGTDTMHFTSAALSFLLKDLTKPVIITGAQRSIDRGSSDAFMNLVCAVQAAAKWNGAEVAVCMHATSNDDYCHLLRGTKVRKMHTSSRDAFKPVNTKPLAKVYPDGKIEKISDVKARSKGKVSLRKIGGTAALVYAYPDMDPGIIDYHVKQKVDAIIFAGTGLGHVPLNNNFSLEPALQKAKKAGARIYVCTQTLNGSVHPYVYANLRKLSIGLGATFLGDMLPETAYAKALVATQEKDSQKFMTDNIAGEYEQ